MLAGQWAVPSPDPTARGGLTPPRDCSKLVVVLPGEVSLRRLSADLSRSGCPPGWISLAPYDRDAVTMDALVTAMSPAGDDQADDKYVVVEADDRGQARLFLDHFERGPRPRAPTTVLVPEHPGRRPPDRRAAPWEVRLRRLTRPRVALHDSLLAAGQRLPPAEFAATVEQSRDADELAVRLVRALLRDVAPTTRSLLGLAALLRYPHPRFESLGPALELCATLPWWIELSGGWRRLDPAWERAVRSVYRAGDPAGAAPLEKLVGELVDGGAPAAAIELCLDAKYPGTAADLLAGLGPDLLAGGRTRAVRRWLGRLPWTERLRRRLVTVQAHALRPDAPPEPAGRPRPGPPADRGANADLDVHLLGPLEARLSGRPVEKWHGRKGALLLACLLLRRHGPPVTRDELASVFWPEAAPEAARNRLHVTLHALRADLQAVSPLVVVQFDRGYRVNPELKVRLDTEQFEEAAARAAEAEGAGDAGTALQGYRAAVDRYRGDLLCEHPFEDWTLLPREHFRVRHLDLLARMAQLAFDAGRYTQAQEAGQTLLALDFCREDVHRLLMRTYARIGRPQAAIQQFEMCTGQLRHELGMAPAAETVELCERIRARVPV